MNPLFAALILQPAPLPVPNSEGLRQLCVDGQQVAASELCPPPRPVLIFFDSGKAELSRDAQAALDELAGRLRGAPSVSLRLVGHSDREGPAGANRRVALRRAELVAEGLRSRGLQSILVESAGEDRPLVATPDGVREPQNRRVEIIFERR
jgi:outer membrane protein OmpA-like peptidoglycan-associated protein